MSTLFSSVLGSSGGDNGIYNTYYYPDLAKSRTILVNLILRTYELEIDGKAWRGNLLEYYKTSDTNDAIMNLSSSISVKTIYDTGITNIDCTTNDPYLSARIANNLVIEIDNFNKKNRAQLADFDLGNYEERLKEQFNRYLEAQTEYVKFQKTHASGTLSPAALADLANLESVRDIHRDIYFSIYKGKELADLEVKKLTPIVTVLDSASTPHEKSFPKKRRILMIVFLVSSVSSMAVTLLKFFINSNLKSLSPEATALYKRFFSFNGLLKYVTSKNN
jgi:uncharacterized protein involved in exopolysaccharide biosynthesis